ncbi:hypothetical protein [Streptococcus anginosus]|uniref:hypothetical protein n=1 Tax=Streptococcus anginosus TaxID=1328 RepID=UPI0023A9D04D|nr:hypothetical protein [Streptococcus anginosus]WEB03942.1 hypothetical protein PUW62_07015 [Streptococcus anginosus]
MSIFRNEKLDEDGKEIFKKEFLEQWLMAIADDLTRKYDNEKNVLTKCEIARTLCEISEMF